MTTTTRTRYTLEFKQEAVRLVEGGQSLAAAAAAAAAAARTLALHHGNAMRTFLQVWMVWPARNPGQAPLGCLRWGGVVAFGAGARPR